MKNKMSKIAFIMLSLVFVLSTCMTVLALTSLSVSNKQDGIEATLNFNKQEYNSNENVEVTLNVKNNNSYVVKNIETELIVPNTMKLSKGSLKQEVFSLNAGENKVQEVALEKFVETNNNESTVNEENKTNSPQTGDNVAIYIAMMVVSAVALVVIAVKKKWIHKKKVMSLVLCFTLVGTMALTSVVNAESTTKEFTVEGTIKYDGEDVVIKGKVTYTHEIYSKLQIDGKNKGMYVEGDTVTITAEDAPEGKHFVGWTVVKGNVTLADKNSKTTTFVMGIEEVEIKANYEVNTYTITSTANAGGTITESATVNYGDSKTFTITPNAHYHIEDVKVDDTSVGKVSSYEFTNVTASHKIDVTFAIDTFTITTKTNDGGSITGNTTVNYNDNATFTITPNSGYGIVDVKVDGSSIGAKTSYEFENVVKNHTIEVIFGVTTEESFRNALSKGGIVNLANDITLNSYLTLSGVKASIEGNGFSLYGYSFSVHDSADITIKNTNCYLTVYNTFTNTAGYLTLDGGYFEKIIIDGGKISVKDGIFKNFDAVAAPYKGLEISGGYFYEFNGLGLEEFVDTDKFIVVKTTDSDGADIWVVTEK